MRNRRRVRSGIDHAWHVVLLSELWPLVHLDLACGVGEIGKVQHRGAIAYSTVKLLTRFDLDQFHTGCAKLVVKRVAVSLLNNDFGLHPGQIGKLLDKAFVIAGKNSGKA